MRNLKLKIKFFSLKKKNKKEGFTLIELVAVMAIIAVLSAAFVPKISGYITEAQKVSVLNEAKNIVTAYESVSYKITSGEGTTVKDLQKDNMPLKDIKINKIPTGTSVAQCRTILTPNSTFVVSPDGKLSSVSGDTVSDLP